MIIKARQCRVFALHKVSVSISCYTFVFMNYATTFETKLHQLIQNALAEDIGDGDHSTLACIEPNARGKAILKIKDNGILAGVDIAEKIFLYSDPTSIIKKYMHDGDKMQSR